ncbi:SCO family protein [Nocardioides panaciterrulae]|uniref:Protein SCO1/2 n=1 Tax=Nocardioides panaciterrulae TaxID=661492 RepID=A0A7Y9E5A1_9ACTN|nr:protein SCO1/2 [Nocardioides panaciterrulae]
MRERVGLAGRLAAGVLAAGVLAGCGGDASGSGGGLHGVTHAAYRVPATPLTDTDGQPFSLVRDTDKPLTLVFFGYSHCPDICQTVMSSLAVAMQRLDDDDRAAVDVVFVTTDPARDTPAALRRYLDRYDPSFIGLTGDLKTIAAIGKSLAVYVAQGQKLPTGGYDLNSHSTQVTAIGSDDLSHVLWTRDTSPAEFADDIHTLLQKSS